ncbi:hypothetical protein AB0A63_15995 [Lentzea sp. NPDC042327]|uniref:nSTAND1 domain-containing NTPase n=1 Tax=Lentzea sp. NPDC042327 TaxID=3154801 RepID=UPI0033D7692E
MGRIFVSYHGHDEGDTIALYLREALLAAGYEDVHAYTAPGSGPTVSLPWKDSLRRELLGAEALIVVTSPGSASEWCIWEVSVFRERKPESPCIEFFSARTQGRVLLNDLQAQSVDASDPASLAAAADMLLGTLSRAGVSTAAGPSSPFPGLKAFDEHQASLFFGRDDDVRRLAEPLLGRRTSGAIAVIGPSGAGKSSLVRAGLIPLLRKHGRTITGPLTPARDAIDIITAGSHAEHHVVVLDQAEELLLGAEDGHLAPEPSALVKALIEASRTTAWVVYTVRADFLDALMQHEEFTPLLRDNFLVNQLTSADLPLVVNGPLRSRGWHVDEEALGSILADTSRGSLPLLAFALENLWWHVNPDGTQPPRAITRAEYLASGRVMDILRRQAEEAFAMARDLVRDGDGSWPDPREAELEVLRTLHRLATVDASGRFTRRPVALRGLSPSERQLLDSFIANRVLTTVRLSAVGEDGWAHCGQDAVEVAHESLFEHWPRLRESLQRDQAALLARRELEGIAADWTRHPDQLIAPSRLTSLLAALWPVAENRSFRESRRQFAEAVAASGLSEDARQLVELSLQQRLDEVVKRKRLLDPEEVLRSLAGDDTSARILWLAPDVAKWKQALLEALSSTPLLRSTPSPGGGIANVAWSPDDTMVATGSSDGKINVRNADRDEPRWTLSHGIGTADVRSIAWSVTGDIIASAGTDEVLRLWSVSEKRELRELPLQGRPVSVRFNAEGRFLLVACANGVVRVWDLFEELPDAMWQFRTPNTAVQPPALWDADISSDGRWVAVARGDGGIVVTSTANGPVSSEHRHIATGSVVHSVRFHPSDNEVLASGSENGSAGLHRMDAERHLLGHTGAVEAVAWSPDGTRLATGAVDGVLRVWDAVTGEEVLRLHVHQHAVRAIAWSHRGDRLATVSADGVERTWKIGSEPDYRWFSAREPVRALAWNPLGLELSVGMSANLHDDRAPSRWTSEVSRRDIRFIQYPAPEALAWTPDGEQLAVGASRGDVLVYDKNFRMVTQLTGQADPALDVHWSADGSLLAVASLSYTGVPRIYGRTGELIVPTNWRDHAGSLRAVRWHPSRNVLAVADSENLITINTLDRTLCSFRTNKRFTCLDWHPGGELLSVGCADATVLVLRLTDELGEESELRGHRDQINVVAWSPDGGSLLTASDDHTARLWDTTTGGQRTALIGHSSAVTAALWLPDDVIVTGSSDRTVRFWDIADGRTHPMTGSAVTGDPDDLIAEARRRISPR